jgi:RNA polymerase-binding protein DksA
MAANPPAVAADYSGMLLQKSMELRARMSVQSAAQVVGRGERASDEGDMSQQSHDEWIFLNRNKLELKLLREVEEAIGRLETEEYGICQKCEEPISQKRLNAVPWAKYCVTCQDLVSVRTVRGDTPEGKDRPD